MPPVDHDAGRPGAPPGRQSAAGHGRLISATVIAARLPGRIRRLLFRPPAAVLSRLGRPHGGEQHLPTTIFALRALGGPPDHAERLLVELATAPGARSPARGELVAIAAAAGLGPGCEAVAARCPDDHAPELELARARTAIRMGSYGEAARLALVAAGHGVSGAAQTLAKAEGLVAVRTPGWLPPVPDPPHSRGWEGASPGPGRSGPSTPVRGRILHLVSSSLPLTHAGYTIRTADVVSCQRGANLDPHVAVRTGHRDATAHGGSAHRILAGTPTTWLGPVAATVRGEADLQVARLGLALDLARELRPAAVQAASDFHQAQLALALRRELGIPAVYEVRGFWEETWAAGFPGGEAAAQATDHYRLTRAVETELARSADAVVTLSEVMRSELVGRGCAPDKVVVIPNAVDAARFEPRGRDLRVAASLGIGPRDPVVGYVSTLNPYEGIPSLLEAVALLRTQVPGLHALVVGDGPDADAIRATARSLGLDGGAVVMPGRVAHDAVASYYSLIDVFVVPRTASRVASLVTPLKPYEAMALGKAVVVSDLPALREIVAPGQTGLTFRAGDAASLAGVIGTLLDDPDLRLRLGEQARAWVLAERTWAANGRRYRELYERLGASSA